MALELEHGSAQKAVVVKASQKLTKEDYEYFVPKIEALIKERGKIRVLFSMDDFHGWKMGALWEDVKFALKNFNGIERLALVGGKKWEEWMAKFCRPFTTARIRYFDRSEAEEATKWIEQD